MLFPQRHGRRVKFFFPPPEYAGADYASPIFPAKDKQTSGKHGGRHGQNFSRAPGGTPGDDPCPQCQHQRQYAEGIAQTNQWHQHETYGQRARHRAQRVPGEQRADLVAERDRSCRFSADHQGQHRADARGGQTENHQRNARGQPLVINIAHTRATDAGLCDAIKIHPPLEVKNEQRDPSRRHAQQQGNHFCIGNFPAV